MYGIKIISIITEDGRPMRSEYFLKNLSEYAGAAAKPLQFESIEDAEIYAQSHEIPNYEISEIT